MALSLVELCVVCITVAMVWLVLILTPTVLRIRRIVGQIGEATQDIRMMIEEAKPIVKKIDTTLDSVDYVINSVKADIERIGHLTSKFKEMGDLIVGVVSNPLIKVLSLMAGITKGISVVRERLVK